MLSIENLSKRVDMRDIGVTARDSGWMPGMRFPFGSGSVRSAAPASDRCGA